METLTDVFVAGREGCHTYRIPALVVFNKGTILCFCEGRRNGSGDGGDIDLLLKSSQDGGRTWSGPRLVHGEPGDITIGNPCPIVEGAVIHLLFSRNNKGLFYTHSTDDGLTWTAPRDLTPVLKEFDYPVVRVGSGPVHGIQTRAGRLVAPVWFCDGEVRDANRSYRSGVLYSDDHGASWNAGGLVPPVFKCLNECAVYEKADGTLGLNMRGSNQGFRLVSSSPDAGLHWTEPALDNQLPCPTCQAALLRLPNGDLAFSNPAGYPGSPGRKNMTVRWSRDEGRSWPEARAVTEGPAGYSDLAALQDGTLLCAFEFGEQRYHEKIVVTRIIR